MDTKTLSTQALKVIDQYIHFKLGNAVCSVPYFNNKTIRARGAFRANIGKGSTKEIYDEIKSILVKDHVDESNITDEQLKKTLTDKNIGIDCSAYAYYILDSELEGLKKVSLKKKIKFINCKGFISKIRCLIRPIENCNVSTLADEKNSKEIKLNEVRPGDIITMLGGPDGSDRDHVLVIYQVEYRDSIPKIIYYTHAVAYPEDGVYGTGIKNGVIEIIDIGSNIIKQNWTESDKTGENNRIYLRAQKSQTSLRRLNILYLKYPENVVI